MLRYVDTFARYIWLWLIPALILPVVAVIILLSTTSYTAIGSLWVDQSLFTDQSSGVVQGNSWESPSQQMAGLFTELMSTRQFVNNIIDTTSYKSKATTDAERLDLIQTITAKTKISGDNFRLISLSYTANKSEVATEVLGAIMSGFQAYYDQLINTQGQASVDYYQKLVTSTKQDLDTATAAVKTFLDEHPNQIGQTTSNNGATTPLDLEYATLNQNLTVARSRYDDANSNLEKVVTSYNAYKQGQSTSIRVQDKPVVLGSAVGKVTQVALGVVIGLAVSAVVAVIGTIVLTVFDSTIRYGFYARDILKKEFLLELPEYKVVKPKTLKKGATIQTEPSIKEGIASKRQQKKNNSEKTLLRTLINQLKGSSSVNQPSNL
ncbi:MAG: hypothetical protein J0I20_34390 [Chloroflexi bacterium]|nr:hypothetical protein [Chloroflexota bacterium]OJV91095.1 MAG: hypothetical protein BGO39_26240 [Chloroflexi bacterium 54-19]